MFCCAPIVLLLVVLLAIPTPPRYLLPVRIDEQESKARLHIAQLTAIAHALDRTLVLPNVAHSRIGPCKPYPFHAYYAHTQPPIALPNTAILVALTPTTSSPRNLSLPKCLHQTLTATHTLSIPDKHRTSPSSIEPNLISSLHALTYSSPLLLIDWSIRNPLPGLIAHSPPPPYAPWIDAYARTITPPHPFVAVHWRMETADPEHASHCARALVNLLTAVLVSPRAEGIRTVYLATDAIGKKSSTFRRIGPLHHAAIDFVRQAFSHPGPLAAYSLIDTLSSASPPPTIPHPTLLNDTGVTGILDKLILSRASFFIAGSKHCARHTSSFTRQIVQARIESQDSDPTIQNIIDTFA